MTKPEDKPRNPKAADPGGPGEPATPAHKEPEVDNSLPVDPSSGKPFKSGEVPPGKNEPIP